MVSVAPLLASTVSVDTALLLGLAAIAVTVLIQFMLSVRNRAHFEGVVKTRADGTDQLIKANDRHLRERLEAFMRDQAKKWETVRDEQDEQWSKINRHGEDIAGLKVEVQRSRGASA